MVKVKEDLTGRVFGKLTVLRQAEDYTRKNGKKKHSGFVNALVLLRLKS